jgi:hypothetical protein
MKEPKKEKPQNSCLVSSAKNKIIPYSAKNKNVNVIAPNSMLKPEINSLSPSEKSKGARLVSARQDKNQGINRGKQIIKGVSLLNLSVSTPITNEININAILTS